jgi:hypothetical protein
VTRSPTFPHSMNSENAEPPKVPGNFADPPLTADLFHCCALAAFVAEARATGGWPNSDATRRRAYALYEAELAAERQSR